MRLFFGRGNCWSCHAGPNLTDERFHNTGVAFRPSTGLVAFLRALSGDVQEGR